MTVGILTYYGDLNCGTNLQAYATLQTVKSAYPDALVEVIPFHGFRMRIIPYKNFSPYRFSEMQKEFINIICSRKKP